MLFCSNFNGTWDQYIDAFADGIPGGLNLFWYSSTKYPGSIPITPFKNYIRANQIDTNYYYNATPGSAQRDIKLALRVAAALRRVDAAADDAALAAAYQQVLREVQGSLGTPGHAPIASCDTSNADLRRCEAVRKRWGEKGTGSPDAVHVVHAVDPQTVAASNVAQASIDAVREAVAKVAPGELRTTDVPPLKPLEIIEPPQPVEADAARPNGEGESADA
jgi:hypothetical protein